MKITYDRAALAAANAAKAAWLSIRMSPTASEADKNKASQKYRQLTRACIQTSDVIKRFLRR